MSQLFQEIIDKMTLHETDREDLRSYRGFSDEVIDRMRFKSLGEFMGFQPGAWWANLPKEIYDGISQRDKENPHKNILIPYFDPKGAIYHIKPHRYGIKDLGIKVYIPFQYLGSDVSTLVIAESEFKALASCLMGVPAIGIPGIGTVSKTKFNMFSDVISSLGVKHAIVCFDNEIKNDPALPNYKSDYTGRYDTEFYAYIMASLIKNKCKIEASVALLDPKWREKGKIDIDGILAKKIPAAEYQKCISRAMTPNQYRESWDMPAPHRSYMERRIERFYYEGPVSERFNCYHVKGKDGDRKISNFTIRIIHTLFDAESKAERLCRFHSNYGNSKAIALKPDAMVSKATFRKFCYELGDYEFEGNEQDLDRIWKYIFMNQDGRSVMKLKSYGYDEMFGVWFFGNGAYLKDKFFPVDDDGIIWLNDIGFRIPDSLTELDIPILSTKETVDVQPPEILTHMSRVLEPNYAKLLLGWTIGNFFMPEILDRYNVYPFLFLHGKQASGKSTIANWISAFFGLPQKGINFHNSSMVGISRTTAQMSMIPVWLEEYRNKDPDIGKKNNFLRGIYDKSTIVKGTKREDEIKTYKPRSTLVVSGEEHPQDAALNSRCLMFPIFRTADDASPEKDASYEWLQKYKGCFNALGHSILLRRNDLWPKILARIEKYTASFNEELKISDRNKIQISIVAGVCDVIFGEDLDFSLFVGDTASHQEIKVRHDQALFVFYEDIYNMSMTGKVNQRVCEIRDNGKHREMNFWFAGAYAQWEIYYKGLRNDIPASKTALLEHMKREPYYMEQRQVRVDGRSVHAAVLNFDHDKFPESLKMIIEGGAAHGLGQSSLV